MSNLTATLFAQGLLRGDQRRREEDANRDQDMARVFDVADKQAKFNEGRTQAGLKTASMKAALAQKLGQPAPMFDNTAQAEAGQIGGMGAEAEDKAKAKAQLAKEAYQALVNRGKLDQEGYKQQATGEREGLKTEAEAQWRHEHEMEANKRAAMMAAAQRASAQGKTASQSPLALLVKGLQGAERENLRQGGFLEGKGYMDEGAVARRQAANVDRGLAFKATLAMQQAKNGDPQAEQKFFDSLTPEEQARVTTHVQGAQGPEASGPQGPQGPAPLAPEEEDFILRGK